MKKIDLLIYDLDGTLVDSAPDIANAVNSMLADLNLKTRNIAEIKGFIGDGVQSLVQRSLGSEFQHHYNQALKLVKKRYSEKLLDCTRLYPGVRETIQFFQNKKQSVLTNKPERFSKSILEGLGVSTYFSNIIGGDTLSVKKPDPAGIKLLMKEFNINSDHVLMIGDSTIDIETARNAGVACCAVTYGYVSSDLLARMQPEFSIDSIQELKSFLE